MTIKIPNFSLIVAVGKNLEIGYKNDLPWGSGKIPTDWLYYTNISSILPYSANPEDLLINQDTLTNEMLKELELNPTNVVIMGRKSWESIPVEFRPLNNRMNIVISRDPEYKCEVRSPEVQHLAQSVTTFQEALELASNLNPVPKHIFITGGSHFYAEAIKHPQCTHLFITEIISDSEWEYDTFFPEYKHLTEYKPLNITNSSVDWLLKVDPQFSNFFKLLKHNKEEGYIIESESIKYKFMLYSKAQLKEINQS